MRKNKDINVYLERATDSFHEQRKHKAIPKALQIWRSYKNLKKGTSHKNNIATRYDNLRNGNSKYAKRLLQKYFQILLLHMFKRADVHEKNKKATAFSKYNSSSYQVAKCSHISL